MRAKSSDFFISGKNDRSEVIYPIAILFPIYIMSSLLIQAAININKKNIYFISKPEKSYEHAALQHRIKHMHSFCIVSEYQIQ